MRESDRLWNSQKKDNGQYNRSIFQGWLRGRFSHYSPRRITNMPTEMIITQATPLPEIITSATQYGINTEPLVPPVVEIHEEPISG